MIHLLVLIAIVAGLSVLAITGELKATNPITLVLLYFDMFLCALLLGSPDLTISSRCGLAIQKGHPWPLVWIGRGLNAITHGKHCGDAIAHDLHRAQAAIARLQR